MNKNINLSKTNKIFCIGIGGIGISAAVRILKDQGKEVLGSDAAKSEITQQLEKESIKVFIPQSENNITDNIDLVVYSVAVPENNSERKKAEELGIAQITYPQLLGLLMKNKYGIGISGTDGKTTTTSMVGKIFIDADLSPTIVVGSKVNYLGGNSTVGHSKYFIFESDEYQRAFHNYFPKIAVITHISADHLDCYKDLDDIITAFKKYLSKVPKDGFVIINNDDETSRQVVNGLKTQIITFAIKTKADLQAQNISIKNGQQIFEINYKGEVLGKISLNLPAKYNIYNSLGAITAALVSGVEFKQIQKSLADFNGAWRRFEKLGQVGESEIITDYAHTPNALKQTIEAIKEFYPNKKILTVFQPHQYNRTKNFFNEFVSAFEGADKAIISDIFYVEGRENPKDFDVDSEKLVDAAKKQGANIEYGGDLEQTEELIRRELRPALGWDVILMVGAGNIYEVAKNLVK